MRVLLAAASLLTAGTTPVWAQEDERPWAEIQEIFDRGCGDDNGTDRCDPDVQQRMRETYGLVDAQTLMAQGVWLRRAMLVDGYGNDVVAVTFARRPGNPPTVAISTPRREGGPDPEPLHAAVSQKVWQRVLASSENFDQRLARELTRQGDDEVLSICLHGWFVVVEAVDPPRLQPNLVGQSTMRGRIRSDSEGACADGLAVPHAFELAAIALDNLPACSSLDPSMARNSAALLALCHRLGGDRIAAGEAMRLVEKLNRQPPSRPGGQEWQWLFAESGRDLAEPLRTALEGGDFYLGTPIARDPDHAEVKGQVAFWGRDEAVDEVADITFSLVRETGDFVIQSFEISPRRSVE